MSGTFEPRRPRSGSILDIGAVPLSARDPFLTDDDLHLFNEGRHFRLYQTLGAHPVMVDGVLGVHFAVWAPEAQRVALVGPDGGADHPLEPRGSSGLWETFVPGMKIGQAYLYRITTRQGGHDLLKADPLARWSEIPPLSASRVWADAYEWNDQEWMGSRGSRHAGDAPQSIYEIHVGSWRRDGQGHALGYRAMAEPLIEHVQRLGFTHVELMPVMEHPYEGSWGYQSLGYFGPSARWGSPADLKHLIDRLHQAGIGVILDWVPSHFAIDDHGLAQFDGSHLYEHADPRQGYHQDWGTYIFNYGRHEVRSYLGSSAFFWLDEFHADGLRVDAVASMLYRDYSREDGEWVPNEFGGNENLEAIHFLQTINDAVHKTHPDVVTAAEESTSWPQVTGATYLGGLGFTGKWDMGWMHDTLAYLAEDPVNRKWHHNRLTFRSVYQYAERYVLPLSHDEVVHEKASLLSKMPGDEWQRFANLRLLYAMQWAQPGKKLLFMGGEFGQPGEWDLAGQMDWQLLDEPAHVGVIDTVAALNEAYRSTPALVAGDWEDFGYRWVDGSDAEEGTLAFARLARDGSSVLAAFNLTPLPRQRRFGVPSPGSWHLIFNGDSDELGGSGAPVADDVDAQAEPWMGFDQSIEIDLPPLAAVFYRSP